MMTKDYVPDWSVSDGIREFIANALDSDYKLEYEVGDDYINLTSVGVTLPVKVLTLGTSENRNKADSIGRHGEGILTGIIPILRNRSSICFRNGDKLWQPEFEYSEAFERDVLVIRETNINSDGNFTVEISGLAKTDIEQAIDNCLYMQEDLGDYVTAPCGSRIFYDFPHKLYVGGLFVCNTQLQFSYDLHPSKITLNRDRKTIDGWDLQGVTARILNSVTDEPSFLERVVGVARTGGNDTYHMKYYGTPKGSEDIAYAQFKESYGEEAIVATDWSDRENLVKQGYDEEKIVVVSQESYAKMVRGSSDYQEYLESIEVTEEETDDRSPVDILQDFKTSYDLFGAEDAFADMLNIFRDRGISWDDNKPHKLDSIPF
jgi:hypothetical protein